MTQSTVKWNTSINHPYYWQSWAFGSSDRLYTDSVVKEMTVVSNDPQHRSKPTELRNSLTPLDAQYSKENNAGWQEIYGNPFWAWKLNPVSGHLEWTQCYHNYRYYSLVPGGLADPYSTGDWATSARNQLKDLKVSLGEDLAEYRETAHMFRDAALGIKHAWGAFRGKHRRRRITPCAIPASVLMYDFGVAPLVGTVYDSVERLRSTLDDPTWVKVMSSAKWSHNISKVVGGGQFEGKQMRSSHAKLWVQYKRGSFSNFTMGNPLEIAWELVPYSFLIDYMIPVGDALSALDALIGVDGIFGTLTHRDHLSGNWEYPPPSGAYTIRYSYYGKVERRQHSREVITTIPMPSFPRWRPSASWHKLRNAVALLWQTRGKC